MAAENKKAQTIRNLWHLRLAKRIIDANADAAAIRAAIVDNGLTGEFTAGELSAMQDVETSLATLAALPGVTAAAGQYTPSHRGQSISIGGVNDG